MSTAVETTGFLTTGDALVDGVLRGLEQSGRCAVENFRALAKAVMWASLRDLEGETAEMASARELMHNGAQFFERARRMRRCWPR